MRLKKYSNKKKKIQHILMKTKKKHRLKQCYRFKMVSYFTFKEFFFHQYSGKRCGVNNVPNPEKKCNVKPVGNNVNSPRWYGLTLQFFYRLSLRNYSEISRIMLYIGIKRNL